ncbi:MAG: leucine-rich repeat domain-containing protein [Firmicutes bacterium]|nr:leucine-rich repeat domain-containing protein [Bacillota bacterium]
MKHKAHRLHITADHISQIKKSGGTVTYEKPSNKNKTSIVIPAAVKVGGKTYQVTKIASNAFKGNTKVRSIKIGANVQTIGANAFNKCTGLKSVSIPGKVKTIQKGAFVNCKNLKSITIKTTKLTKASVGKNAFKGIYAKAVIKVPKGKASAYKKFLQARGLSKKVRIK